VQGVRVDKWLWAARFFKTRSLATEAVLAGHVHVGGKRVKPSKELRVGETVEVRRGELRWTITVTALSDRRGPATAAATLYEEAAASIAAREQQRLERKLARPLGAELGERPTKQARRRLDALRRGDLRRRGS
jgi:ribosome-associated heat shock protein Hsp15